MIWKTLAGRCIHRTSDHITIYQNTFYRWLTFQSDAIQTLIHRKYPSKIALAYAHELTLLTKITPGNCCLLGLGGGGVAHALAPYIKGNILLAVEKNATVIDIAKHYFMTDSINQLTVLNQAAEVFVEEHNATYSYLLVDLFNAHTFPNECLTEGFFLNCQRLLTAEGILALNIANPEEQLLLWQHIKRLFGNNTILLPVKGCANVVIWACHPDTFSSLLSWLKNSAYLKALSWDAHWGYVAEIRK